MEVGQPNKKGHICDGPISTEDTTLIERYIYDESLSETE